MGKALLIKGADFENVAVDKIQTHYNDVGKVDLSQYTNLHVAITSNIGQNPYEVVDASKADAYIVPVVQGERYKLKYCCGALSSVALGLSGTELVLESGMIQNVEENILIINGTQGQTYYDNNAQFTIAEGVDSIIISGRNSSHGSFVAGYDLTLTRLS